MSPKYELAFDSFKNIYRLLSAGKALKANILSDSGIGVISGETPELKVTKETCT